MAHKYTEEQAKFIRDNVQGRSTYELTQLFNKTFGLNLEVRKIRAYMKNHGLRNGINAQFKKGHIPANKGTKGLYNVGGNRTSFKKGNKPQNYKPIGYERVDREGYVLVKVSDTGPWHQRWKHKHKVIWEEANGPIPKGYKLIFLDGNKQNISLDNLQLVTSAQLARLNQHHLIFNNPDLTRTGVLIADIYDKIGKRKRKAGEK